MRTKLAILLLAARFLVPSESARAADLREPGIGSSHTPGRHGGPVYSEIWRRSDPLPPRPFRPGRRVMGGPDYVGSNYGLGKPSYSGIGPRPDWGRSNSD